MPTFNALYVRITDSITAASLMERHPAAFTDHNTDFFAVPFPSEHTDCPEDSLRSLSAEFQTNVMWLGFQTDANTFEFHHWRNGELLRSLTYGRQHRDIWDRVEGVTEPWEIDGLFDQEVVASAFQQMESSEHRGMQQLSRPFRITPGQPQPRIDAQKAVRHVGEHYRLPGWEPDPPPEKPPLKCDRCSSPACHFFNNSSLCLSCWEIETPIMKVPRLPHIANRILGGGTIGDGRFPMTLCCKTCRKQMRGPFTSTVLSVLIPMFLLSAVAGVCLMNRIHPCWYILSPTIPLLINNRSLTRLIALRQPCPCCGGKKWYLYPEPVFCRPSSPGGVKRYQSPA